MSKADGTGLHLLLLRMQVLCLASTVRITPDAVMYRLFMIKTVAPRSDTKLQRVQRETDTFR